MKRVVILGAGGHAHVVADVVRACGDDVVAFLDDNINAPDCGGPISDYAKFDDCEFIIGIGDAEIREKMASLPVIWYTAIHPSAVISPNASIDVGTVVMPNAVINTNTAIGKHCIINSGAIVEHDNIIENFVHISVGAKLGGTVKIKKNTWVGIGAVVINNVSVCANCFIGAGAVVVKNIDLAGTYIGVPAKIMKR